MQPIIVYFPDSSQWLSRAVSKANRGEFIQKMEETFDKISGPVVLICGQNKIESGSKEKEKLVSSGILPKYLDFLLLKATLTYFLLFFPPDYDTSKYWTHCQVGNVFILIDVSLFCFFGVAWLIIIVFNFFVFFF